MNEVNEPRLQSVNAFLAREAELVDKKQWDEWLALFADNVEYWVPAWDSDTEYTGDPDSELSLIYYSSKQGLGDRVYRLRTGMSSASLPLPRTCHLVTNVRARFRDEGLAEVEANWQALSQRRGQTTAFFGFYEYLLEPSGASWRIRKKKIIVLNDTIPNVLDIYSI